MISPCPTYTRPRFRGLRLEYSTQLRRPKLRHPRHSESGIFACFRRNSDGSCAVSRCCANRVSWRATSPIFATPILAWIHPIWQRLLYIKRTSSTTGATNPKGSKSEFTVESRPRRVRGLNGKATENLNVSDCTFHATPNIRSCSLQSNACTCHDFVSSSSGTLANTSSPFDNHFVSQKPAFANKDRKLPTSLIAVSTSETEVKQSSTYIHRSTVDATTGS